MPCHAMPRDATVAFAGAKCALVDGAVSIQFDGAADGMKLVLRPASAKDADTWADKVRKAIELMSQPRMSTRETHGAVAVSDRRGLTPLPTVLEQAESSTGPSSVQPPAPAGPPPSAQPPAGPPPSAKSPAGAPPLPQPPAGPPPSAAAATQICPSECRALFGLLRVLRPSSCASLADRPLVSASHSRTWPICVDSHRTRRGLQQGVPREC